MLRRPSVWTETGGATGETAENTRREKNSEWIDRAVCYISLMTSETTCPSPALTFHWFLPTSGDSRGIVGGGHGAAGKGGDRLLDLRYLRQLVQAAETNGFDSVLTPTGTWCKDPWITDAALIEATETIRFLIAVRPGLVSPTLLAQAAADFQTYSGNRLAINIVTGGEDREQQAFGDFLTKEQRYDRTAEFLEIVTRLWRGEKVTYDGEHLRVRDAFLSAPPTEVPRILFGGSSAAAGQVAARYVDAYLTWGEPPSAVEEKITWINGLAAQQRRTVAQGVRFHVISRDTTEEAWAVAEKLLGAITPDDVRAAQEGFRTSGSEGQRRMSQLHARGAVFTGSTTARDLEIHPNVWAGVGLVRGGAGTALVGSHAEVADRIIEYSSVGATEFVLSGYPDLEEAYYFGEGVVPELLARGVRVTNHPTPAPVGVA